MWGGGGGGGGGGGLGLGSPLCVASSTHHDMYQCFMCCAYMSGSLCYILPHCAIPVLQGTSASEVPNQLEEMGGIGPTVSC